MNNIPHPSSPHWAGPIEGGITQSHLIKFLECPFAAYLYFYCGLRDPTPPHENLPWGSIMHKGLEHLIRGDDLHTSMQAMYDYYTTQYIHMPDEVIYTCFEMLKLFPVENFSQFPDPITEHKIHTTVTTPREVTVRGMADVYVPGTFLCDHKCKGRIYPAECAEELCDDFQMNFYSYILRTPNWRYDLIQCPLVAYGLPNKRPGVSAEAYAHHIFHTYDNSRFFWPIAKFKPMWICSIPHYQPLETVDAYFTKTISPAIERMCQWWDYITSPNFDPNNPECYNQIFYKNSVRVFDASKTDKYKGNFHGVKIGTMDYSELQSVSSYYPELE